jgi:hypothetical protein
MSIADKFRSEWKPILGRVYNAVPADKLETEFDSFVKVPASRRVTPRQNSVLMENITTEKVIKAISDLNRHKAAGPDGLNNDFFQGCRGTDGASHGSNWEPTPPRCGATTVVSRKFDHSVAEEGDSTNAMDFRPISLLQTAFKFFRRS